MNSAKTAFANKLHPISPASSGFGQWEPSPVPHTYCYQHLPRTGYKFRPDLDGVIQNQNGFPVIEVEADYGPELFIVGNAQPAITAAWAKETEGK